MGEQKANREHDRIERKRSCTSVKNARPGLTVTPHRVERVLSSAKTVDAPKSNTASPMIVASTPLVFSDALACTVA